MNSTHRVEVVPVELRTHPNADSLSLVSVFGYQVVVKTADWQGRSIGAYIPPDSIVPDTPEYAFVHGAEVGTATERQRRIKARRFRGEWSQGLLMPAPEGARIGDDVAAQMGITHYESPEPKSTGADAERFVKKSPWPRSWRGWLHLFLFWLGFKRDGVHGMREAGPDILYPKYDVDTWYRYKNLLVEGERVVITEKIHGSNARYVWSGGRMWCGSRAEWKRKGANIWWEVLEANPWIEQWCKANPDAALYGEVTPTQDLKYGGAKQFFPFDIRKESRWLNWNEVLAVTLEAAHNENTEGCFWSWAPVLYAGPYSEAKALELRDGKTAVKGASHVREGVVIRPQEERMHPAIGRVQLKAVSPAYLERAQ